MQQNRVSWKRTASAPTRRGRRRQSQTARQVLVGPESDAPYTLVVISPETATGTHNSDRGSEESGDDGRRNLSYDLLGKLRN